MQRSLAWALRKDDAHTSRSVDNVVNPHMDILYYYAATRRDTTTTRCDTTTTATTTTTTTATTTTTTTTTRRDTARHHTSGALQLHAGVSRWRQAAIRDPCLAVLSFGFMRADRTPGTNLATTASRRGAFVQPLKTTNISQTQILRVEFPGELLVCILKDPAPRK